MGRDEREGYRWKWREGVRYNGLGVEGKEWDGKGGEGLKEWKIMVWSRECNGKGRNGGEGRWGRNEGMENNGLE